MWYLLLACGPPPPGVGSPVDTATADDTDDPMDPGRQWVEVSTHPCARDGEGWVECWNRVDAPNDVTWNGRFLPIPPSPFPVTGFFAPDSSAVAGVRTALAESSLESWFCGAEWHSGGAYPPWNADTTSQCVPPADPRFQAVGYGSGLTTDGQVWAWTLGPPRRATRFPTDRSYRLFTAPSRRIGVLDTENVAWVEDDYNDVYYTPFTHAFTADLVIVELVLGGNGVCVLTAEGEIQCVGEELPGVFPAPMAFPNPPYRDIAGGYYAVCAVREDWTIECHDGSTHHFGPLRDLAVHAFAGIDPVTGDKLYDEGPRAGLGLCVITEANAIRCVGERYTPDVLAQLPGGTP